MTIFFPTGKSWYECAQWLDARGLYRKWDGRTGLHCDRNRDGQFQWRLDI